jgi:hypothetical protein
MTTSEMGTRQAPDAEPQGKRSNHDSLSGQFIGAVVRCSYTATVTVSYGFKNESFGFVLGSGTAT